MTSLKNVPPDVMNADNPSDVVLLCDHASNHVPEELHDLGLDADALADHIAWDIGAEDVARTVARMMQAPAIIARVSRLVIDVNRDLAHEGLIPPVSDNVPVPGNRGLSSRDTDARVKAYYDPFHRAVEDVIAKQKAFGRAPFVVGIHSFTPVMNGTERPWHIGFMWDKDSRLAQALIGILERETDLVIGANKPYSGQDLYYSTDRHGVKNGFCQTVIEIRQDLLTTAAHREEWAVLLANSLDECFQRADLMGEHVRTE